MQNTHNSRELGSALIELIGFLNSPRRDDALLREANVTLDRALLALLVALGKRGTLGVVELADLVGRDHTTISRQLAKLESLALITRPDDASDRRRRSAQLTDEGTAIVRAVTAARQRLLSRALSNWSDTDRTALAGLLGKFVESLSAAAKAG